jgi:uncharacterized protein (TIGR02217 family)
MSLTVLSDVLLSEAIVAAGIRGKNQRNNNRVTSTNGQMQINIQSDRTLRQYQLGVVPLTAEQWGQIEALHEVTEGGAYGFLMQDPKDRSVQAGQGFLQSYNSNLLLGTVGHGYGVPTYRLIKRYTVIGTARFKDRLITRPQVNPQLQKNGTTISSGGGPGQFSINSATGVLTINEDASAYLASATVGGTTVLNFGSGTFASLFAVGGRVWLQNVGGTASAVLNNRSHEVLSVSGNTLTINTSTAGLSLTDALAKRYPQPIDTLTWSGLFYVPVHFLEDDIDWELALGGNFDSRLVAGPNVVVQEVRE